LATLIGWWRSIASKRCAASLWLEQQASKVCKSSLISFVKVVALLNQ